MRRSSEVRKSPEPAHVASERAGRSSVGQSGWALPVHRGALPSSDPKTVLIYRFGSLGDTVVALPCFHLIARIFPSAKRILLTNLPVDPRAPSAAQVLNGSGLVDDYLAYPLKAHGLRALKELRRAVRQMRPDMLIYLPSGVRRSFSRVLREVAFFRFCGIGRMVGVPFSRGLRQNRWLADKELYESEASRLSRCLSSLGETHLNERSSWDLCLTDNEALVAARLLESWPGSNSFFAVSVGTKMQAKDWGVENWRTMLGQLQPMFPQYGMVLLGSAEERAASELASANWAGPRLNLCGRLTPRESAALLQHASVFIGHDSGPMHLASAVGISTVAIFAAREKPGVWFPNGDKHTVIYHLTPCAGCQLTVCIKNGKQCISSITVDEVLGAVAKLLRSVVNPFRPINAS